MQEIVEQQASLGLPVKDEKRATCSHILEEEDARFVARHYQNNQSTFVLVPIAIFPVHCRDMWTGLQATPDRACVN
jgi:hypothetical protein